MGAVPAGPGAVVRVAEKNRVKINELPFDEVQKIHPKLGKDWVDVFDLKRAMAKRVGMITASPGVWLQSGNKHEPLEPRGWEHTL